MSKTPKRQFFARGRSPEIGHGSVKSVKAMLLLTPAASDLLNVLVQDLYLASRSEAVERLIRLAISDSDFQAQMKSDSNFYELPSNARCESASSEKKVLIEIDMVSRTAYFVE